MVLSNPGHGFDFQCDHYQCDGGDCDADSDRICDAVDSCEGEGEDDRDSDFICDAVDSCLQDPANDADSDFLCDTHDCFNISFWQKDGALGDGICHSGGSLPVPDFDCERFACDNGDCDADSDNVCDSDDNCEGEGTVDDDSDMLCDHVDSCLGDWYVSE